MNNNGVIYYKLEERYDGDITKYCGLTGGEVDSNMFFLRGNDIESVKWNDDNETLVFTRVNGETIIIEGINNPITADKTYYDPETGVLHLTINGTTYNIEGFYVREEITGMTYSNSTLKGRGTVDNPISVSDTLRTGFFAPVERFIDLTVKGNSLPVDPLHGSRFLTKENVNDFGLLYNFEGVKRIQQILKDESSMWRVPTFEEWSEMFNAVESDDSHRNHLEYKSNKYNGLKAGAILKKGRYVWNLVKTTTETQEKYGSILPKNNILPLPSHVEFLDTLKDNVYYEIQEDVDGVKKYKQYSCIDIWDKSSFATPSQNIKEEYNFSVIPVGVADRTSHNYKEHFGKKTGFWSTTQDDTSDVWAKYFFFDKDGIKTQLEGTENYLSVRLVRDYLDNFSEVEIINGIPYNTVLMPSVVVDENGKVIKKSHKVWTHENVSFNELLTESKNNKPLSINVKDENGITEEHFTYFINYWNGKSWDKRTFNHNEMIIIGTGPDGSKDEEWQLNNNELVRRSKEIIETINSRTSELFNELVIEHDADVSDLLEKHNTDIQALNNNIETESADRTSADAALGARIDDEIAARESADEALGARIDEEIAARKESIATVNTAIETESADRTSADAALGTRIDDEIAARESADEALGARIDEEIAARKESIATVNTAIETESADRTSADAALGTRIDDEIAARIASDDVLNAIITKNNIISIVSSDNSISPSFSQSKDGTTINLDTKLDSSCEFLIHDDGGLSDRGIKAHVSDEIKKSSDSLLKVINNNKAEKDNDKEILLAKIGEVASKSSSDDDALLEKITNNKADLNASLQLEETSRIDGDHVLDLKISDLSSKVESNKITQENTLANAVSDLNRSISSEMQRASSAESNIMSVIGEGYSGETITNKLNTVANNSSTKINDINTKLLNHDSNITDINNRLNSFFNDAEISAQAIDTLKEIQNYIDSDEGVVANMISNIEKAQSSANNAQLGVDNLGNVVETNRVTIENSLKSSASELSNRISTIESDYLKESDKTYLAGEINKAETNRINEDVALRSEIESQASIINLTISNLDKQINERFNNTQAILDRIDNSLTTNTSTILEHGNSIIELNNKDNVLDTKIDTFKKDATTYTDTEVHKVVDALNDFKNETNSKFTEILGDMEDVSNDLSDRIEGVNVSLRDDIGNLQNDFREEIRVHKNETNESLSEVLNNAKTWVREQEYLIQEDIKDFVKEDVFTNTLTTETNKVLDDAKTWVREQSYLIDSDIKDFVKKDDFTNTLTTETNKVLDDAKTWVREQEYITLSEVPETNLNGYATEEWVNEQNYAKSNDVENTINATKQSLESNIGTVSKNLSSATKRLEVLENRRFDVFALKTDLDNYLLKDDYIEYDDSSVRNLIAQETAERKSLEDTLKVEIVATKNTAITHATKLDDAMKTRVGAIEQQLEELVIPDYKQNITEAINEWANQVSPENTTVDTFKELIDYAATHSSEYSELAGVVQGMKESKVDKTTLETTINELEENINTAISTAEFAQSKVEALEGSVETLDNVVANKQDELISGETIKTINGNSILGHGDLVINGEGTVDLSKYVTREEYEGLVSDYDNLKNSIKILTSQVESLQNSIITNAITEITSGSENIIITRNGNSVTITLDGTVTPPSGCDSLDDTCNEAEGDDEPICECLEDGDEPCDIYLPPCYPDEDCICIEEGDNGSVCTEEGCEEDCICPEDGDEDCMGDNVPVCPEDDCGDNESEGVVDCEVIEGDETNCEWEEGDDCYSY